MKIYAYLHEDFHIRQLYYPYRLWESKVDKPVRLIFSIYTNKIFRLMEYRFKEKENYSSIELVRTKNYSLEDTSITLDEIKDVYDSIKDTEVISDNMNVEDSVPFIQADNFERIVSLLENMYENPILKENIDKLKSYGYRFIEAEEGLLACNYVAKGRMSEPKAVSYTHLTLPTIYSV